MDFRDILRIAREILYCPVCGAHFDLEKIAVRGMFDDKYIIQTECRNNHQPVRAIFISSIAQQQLDQILEPSTSLSGDNILDLKLALNNFDGDFEKVFKHRLNNGRNST